MQISSYENAVKFLPTNKKYRRYILDNNSFAIKNEIKTHCFVLWRTSVITWDGRVVPCCFDKDATNEIGLLMEERLEISGNLRSISTLDKKYSLTGNQFPCAQTVLKV